MKEEKDKLRDFMQGVFQDYEVAPDPEDWDRIGKTLSERKRRRIIPWIIWASAASLLLLLTLYTGGILNHTDKTVVRTNWNASKTDKTPSLSNAKSVVKEPVSTNHPAEKINQNKATNVAAVMDHKTVKETITVQSATSTKPDTRTDQRLIAAPKTTASKNTLLTGNKPNQIAQVNVKDKSVSTDQTTFNNAKDHNLMVHAITLKNTGLISNQGKYKAQLKEQSGSVLTGIFTVGVQNAGSDLRFTGLALSNSSGMIIQASGKEFMSYNGAFASQLASNMFANSVKVFDNSLLSTLNIGNLFQNNTRNYLPPITFGLNASLSLENNLSIETGIQYTRLQSSGSVSISSSNAIQFTTSFGYHVDENLYYLGVPIILNYNFAQQRKHSFYISGGISAEKGLVAKYKATPVDNYPGMEPIYSHNAIKGMQYSLFGGVGISYRFIKHFELFGQPSLTWYLKSDGKNNTVYSVHPLIFNLRTGIRYTIK